MTFCQYHVSQDYLKHLPFSSQLKIINIELYKSKADNKSFINSKMIKKMKMCCYWYNKELYSLKA